MSGRWPPIPAALVLLALFFDGAAASGGPDPLIGQMTRRVSESQLEALLLALTGEAPVWLEDEEVRFETRASYTDGMLRASKFLEQEFRRFGLEVCRQTYVGWVLLDVAFSDSLRGWVVGDGGVILRTEDGGRRWARQGLAGEHLYGISTPSPDCALVVGRGGLVYRTEDGGEHWQSVGAGSRALRGVSFVDSLDGWVCGNAGALFRTRDSGASWEPVETPVAPRLYSVVFVDSCRGWVAGNYGYVLDTRDGGRSWRVSQLEGQPVLRAMDFVDSLAGWVGGDGGRFYRTVDGGASWVSGTLDPAVTIQDLEFDDEDLGWAVGAGGHLFETADGGRSWSVSSPAAPADLWAIAVGHGRMWIVGDYTILESRDGLSWEDRTGGVEGRWVNVEATLPGLAAPEEYYLLCGHFDSISEMSDLRAPGANDNASGTALVVAAARALSGYRFEKTLKFVCFSGEEQGLRGSFNYAADLWREGNLPDGVINADMVGYDTGNEDRVWIGSGGYGHSLALAQTCSTVVFEYDLDLVPSLEEGYYGQSDHLSFAEFGVPAVMLSEAEATAYPYIHSVGDRFRFLNLAFAREVTRLAVAAAATLAVPIPVDPTAEGSPLRLARLWPNPFGNQAGIRYAVPGRVPVALRIYDVRGRLLRTLVDDVRNPGVHEVWWDGRDDAGRRVPPGIFFVDLRSEGQRAASKLVRVE